MANKQMKTNEAHSCVETAPPNLSQFLERDSYITPFTDVINRRYAAYTHMKHWIEEQEGSLGNFALGYTKFGLNSCKEGIIYREWAPGAVSVSLTGTFCDWDRDKYPCTKDEFGIWSTIIPNHEDGSQRISEESLVKVCITTPSGERIDRIPAWITRAVQPKGQIYFEGVHIPKGGYEWKHARPTPPKSLKIYEAHVGIASEEHAIASYDNFTDNVIPRIVRGGYNAIQLMAIMEHAYYGSFGYQVTNFFAASSRYGPCSALKRLIDTAHAHNVVVLLDVVHSHASKNSLDGLSLFDGTDSCYFHDGPRGYHDLGVASYHDYFGPHADEEAIVYLMLANTLVHQVYPDAITVAEDVSGYPGICRPVDEGGLGFDYKLAMAIPDMWIKMLKEQADEEWDMSNIVHNLENRRYKEKSIAYCESHDQALVGDKTIAFWLMDKEMYTHMSVLSEPNIIVDRGIALHKMIRFITHALGGEGYLNFIGNEFGHPEWLDFPREGNNESYQYARRQWHLESIHFIHFSTPSLCVLMVIAHCQNCFGAAEDHLLKYQHLLAWDTKMQRLEDQYHWLQSEPGFVTCKHNDDKVIAFERAGLVFAFNFHATKSFPDYRIAVEFPGKYRPIVSTDDSKFGGHGRIYLDINHFSEPMPWHGRGHSMLVYLPSRCAVVYARDGK
eukprot:gene11040-3109_t